MTKPPILVAVTSDHHCGSTLGLCPPEGVRLDDGGTYRPSKAQKWVWRCWEEYWGRADALRKQHSADLYCCYNGDLFEGDHHHTSQIISRNPEPQAYIADRVFGVPRALSPTATFIIRGTEAHVGPSGASEEAFARSLKAEPDPVSGKWSWWHLRQELHGVLLDFQHHGRMGQRPWTESNVVSLLAAQIFYEHARRKQRYPDLAIRSHHHRHADSGDAHPVRVIQTPAWQLKTAHAHKVAADSLADVGGIFIIIQPDGRWEVLKSLFFPGLPDPWKPTNLVEGAARDANSKGATS